VTSIDGPIAASLREVRQRIHRAALACGRDPASVRLVAVSKTKPEADLREAYAAGQRLFGENYAQEFIAKAEALADLPDLEWHFVGHLQSNKAKYVARHAHLVHTVDSAALARELAKRVAAVGRPSMRVLIEVNVGGETQKHGVAPAQVTEVVDAIAREPHLRLRGLMTIPPADDPAEARRVFESLRVLRDKLGGSSVLPELSMGMSGDLEEAIAAGATLVRVGTAIFGERRRD
jgi:pyridoxal phosphate enzyme (YggS family)